MVPAIEPALDFAETTMKMFPILLAGAAAVVVATAANYPEHLGLYGDAATGTLRQREALDTCALQDRSFVRFLASDREQCYRQMRGMTAAPGYSGVWSKPDRAHPVVAEK